MRACSSTCSQRDHPPSPTAVVVGVVIVVPRCPLPATRYLLPAAHVVFFAPFAALFSSPVRLLRCALLAHAFERAVLRRCFGVCDDASTVDVRCSRERRSVSLEATAVRPAARLFRVPLGDVGGATPTLSAVDSFVQLHMEGGGHEAGGSFPPLSATSSAGAPADGSNAADTSSSRRNFGGGRGGGRGGYHERNNSRGAAMEPPLPNPTLVVKNLHFELSHEDVDTELGGILEAASIPLGQKYRSLHLHKDHSGVFRGMSFLNFRNVDHAAAALVVLRGANVRGRKIRAEYRMQGATGGSQGARASTQALPVSAHQPVRSTDGSGADAGASLPTLPVESPAGASAEDLYGPDSAASLGSSLGGGRGGRGGVSERTNSRGAAMEPPVPNPTLVVKNLHFELTHEDVDEELSGLLEAASVPAAHKYRSLHLHKDYSGTFRGMSFLNFRNVDHAAAALVALRGADVRGRKIRAEYRTLRPGERPRAEGGRPHNARAAAEAAVAAATADASRFVIERSTEPLEVRMARLPSKTDGRFATQFGKTPPGSAFVPAAATGAATSGVGGGGVSGSSPVASSPLETGEAVTEPVSAGTMAPEAGQGNGASEPANGTHGGSGGAPRATGNGGSAPYMQRPQQSGDVRQHQQHGDVRFSRTQGPSADEERRTLIASRLVAFIESPAVDLRFEADLTSYQRRIVHTLADEMGLGHLSVNVPDTAGDRTVMVTKDPARKALWAASAVSVFERSKKAREAAMERKQAKLVASRGMAAAAAADARAQDVSRLRFFRPSAARNAGGAGGGGDAGHRAGKAIGDNGGGGGEGGGGGDTDGGIIQPDKARLYVPPRQPTGPDGTVGFSARRPQASAAVDAAGAAVAGAACMTSYTAAADAGTSDGGHAVDAPGAADGGDVVDAPVAAVGALNVSTKITAGPAPISDVAVAEAVSAALSTGPEPGG